MAAGPAPVTWDGTVVVKEGNRHATGEHLTYTAADDTYVMTGKPVAVDEITPPQCRKTRGATLTFQRSVDKVVVVGIPDVLPMVATPYACTGAPAARDLRGGVESAERRD